VVNNLPLDISGDGFQNDAPSTANPKTVQFPSSHQTVDTGQTEREHLADGEWRNGKRSSRPNCN
jgi:hypothetical protein